MTADVLMNGQLSFFRSQGFEVAVAAASSGALDRVAARECVQTFPIPFVREMSPLRDTLALPAMVACLNDFKPHIVNAGTPKAGLLGLTVARLMRVPSRLYLLRGLRLETTHGVKRKLLRFCERRASGAAHKVICVSPSLKAVALRERIARPDRIHVLGNGSSNGVEVARFVPRPERVAEASEIRRQLEIPQDATVIGFIGRLTRDKGIRDLMEAFQRLATEFPKLYLLVVGPVEGGDPVSGMCLEQMRRHPRIRLAGRQGDVAPYHLSFDLLAFPSYREGLPNVPLEAAAAGRPVVGYAATGTVDAVCSGVTGRLVRCGDWEGLSDALRSYVVDPSLRKAHGLSGRTFASANFDQQQVWNRWLDLYRYELRRIGVSPAASASQNPARWKAARKRPAA
jgi:glycosyltransferase involved in cell wall biosynthesis